MATIGGKGDSGLCGEVGQELRPRRNITPHGEGLPRTEPTIPTLEDGDSA